MYISDVQTMTDNERNSDTGETVLDCERSAVVFLASLLRGAQVLAAEPADVHATLVADRKAPAWGQLVRAQGSSRLALSPVTSPAQFWMGVIIVDYVCVGRGCGEMGGGGVLEPVWRPLVGWQICGGVRNDYSFRGLFIRREGGFEVDG
jgi:hypothetical protein